MLAAAGAWTALADELGAVAESFAAVTSGLTGQAWQGPAATAMATAAAPYARWLSAAASQAAGASAQANAVVQRHRKLRKRFRGTLQPRRRPGRHFRPTVVELSAATARRCWRGPAPTAAGCPKSL
ncbi:PPE domain-containing protein [Mycobacterium bourgelatii]|nr:PPE domain-containing protein [Mycobacterium bourgelatii]